MPNNTAAVVWNGFHFQWEKYPHRLSILGSRFHAVTDEEQALRSFEHELKIKIGNWPPERALYTVPYYTLQNNRLFLAKGYTELETSSMIECGATTTSVIKIPVADLLNINPEVQDVENVTILLNGFHIESINNQSGWHFGGLGIELSEAQIVDGVLSFKAEAFARPARSPELLTHGNRQWNYRSECQYKFHIDFLVIGGDKSVFHCASTDLEQQDITERKTFSHNIKTSIPGVANAYQQALTGISGFRFKLEAHDKAMFKKRTGRYIREMGFLSRGLQYDAQTGRGKADVSLTFSNEPERFRYLANKLKMESAMKLHLIQLNGADTLERGQLEGFTQKRLLQERKPLLVRK